MDRRMFVMRVGLLLVGVIAVFAATLGAGAEKRAWRADGIYKDPAAQVQLALDNMKQTLAAASMDFRHVVFVNPYMTDKASSQMNDIYAKHFEFGNTPARATYPGLEQISLIAVK
jgi:enamine deaminase RidA (YjgF/YER057c/UK114 family)